MRILQANDTYTFVNINDQELHLLDSSTLNSVGYLKIENKASIISGSLQYGTGVVAYSVGSSVHIYDFLYKREIEVVETYKTISKLCLRKNLLIVVSQQRILIYNLQKKQNECYIQTLNGKLVFLDDNYFRLSIFYPQDHLVLTNKFMWKNIVNRISTGLKYQFGCYVGKEAQMVALALENTLSFYQQIQMVKVYGYEHKILQIQAVNLPSPMTIVMLDNNQIIAQDIKQQWKFNFQQLPIIPLLQIQSKLTTQKPVEKCQRFFWTAKGKIFHYIKTQTQQVKLYVANINERQQTKIQTHQLICRKSYFQNDNPNENILSSNVNKPQQVKDPSQ